MNKRLVDTFCECVQIDSHSKQEGKFHDYLKEKFASLGLSLREDDSMEKTGLGGNNLIFTLAGDPDKEPVFISAHTDTVVPGEGIEPVIRDGKIYSKGDTILAADDKAGIAIMLELIQQIQENNIPHPTLEFVLSPGEEIGLVGVSALDMNLFNAKKGLVLDSGGPVGAITMASPTLCMMDTVIHGKAAHAGMEPEKGISAIRVLADIISALPNGRVNPNTTANVGVIAGGAATNVVCDEASMKHELRSIVREEFDAHLADIENTIKEISDQYGAGYDFSYDIKSVGYNFPKDDEWVVKIVRAMETIGLEARYEISGGGSDANVFNAHGRQAVNISIGYEDIHTVNEYIPIAELEKAVELVLTFVRHAAGE